MASAIQFLISIVPHLSSRFLSVRFKVTPNLYLQMDTLKSLAHLQSGLAEILSTRPQAGDLGWWPRRVAEASKPKDGTGTYFFRVIFSDLSVCKHSFVCAFLRLVIAELFICDRLNASFVKVSDHTCKSKSIITSSFINPHNVVSWQRAKS